MEQQVAAGEIRLDISGVPQGVYLLKLIQGQDLHVVKVTILR